MKASKNNIRTLLETYMKERNLDHLEIVATIGVKTEKVNLSMLESEKEETLDNLYN